MKTKQLFSALFTGAFSLCLSMQAQAQNRILHITDPTNNSLDYMPGPNKYFLHGVLTPPTVGPWSNTSPWGFFGRIQLQVVGNDPAFTTSLYKTYCTMTELAAVQQGLYNLSVYFQPADAKHTSDGGFIMCGYVQHLAEFSPCPGADYSNPYLLKTDAAGNVQWYKRYGNTLNPTFLRSVVEDPATGNFVVCGKTEYVTYPTSIQTAFMMGVSPLGNVVWAHNTLTHDYANPRTAVPSSYSEVTPYTDPASGNRYLVLTGNVGLDFLAYGYPGGILNGGGLLTTIDGNGVIYNNVYITQDGFSKFMQLKGVNDAHDGDVVLTGFSGAHDCGTHDASNLMIMKINPLTLASPFMKVYETNPSNIVYQSFGYSVTVPTGVQPGVIAVVGDEAGGIDTETDFLGNVLRYVTYNSSNEGGGRAVVYNTNNNYTVHSGLFAGGTTLIKNKYGADCDPNLMPQVTPLPHDIVLNSAIAVSVAEIPDMLMGFNITSPQGQVCGGMAKPGPASVKANVPVVNSLTLSPNPAEGYVDVQLPNTLKNGNIRVYDMTGRIVLSHKANDATGPVRLDVMNLAKGVYIMAAESNGTKEHTTFIKQ